MNILDVAFVEELVDACQYFWEAGWGEYHAGKDVYKRQDELSECGYVECRK